MLILTQKKLFILMIINGASRFVKYPFESSVLRHQLSKSHLNIQRKEIKHKSGLQSEAMDDIYKHLIPQSSSFGLGDKKDSISVTDRQTQGSRKAPKRQWVK